MFFLYIEFTKYFVVICDILLQKSTYICLYFFGCADIALMHKLVHEIDQTAMHVFLLNLVLYKKILELLSLKKLVEEFGEWGVLHAFPVVLLTAGSTSIPGT